VSNGELEVQVGWPRPPSDGDLDNAFNLVVTCSEEVHVVINASGGSNAVTVPNAEACGLTGSWYDPSPNGLIYGGNYVSTWANASNSGLIMTKNAGYGVAVSRSPQDFGVDLVATC
jgi:hypothetical protein